MAKKPKKPQIRITELISVNKTADARKLLKKYGKEDATSYQDLEKKLTELYQSTEDKKQLEKEIAEMHPHKEFILSNLAPKSVDEKDITNIAEPIESKRGKLTVVNDGYSNCEGNPDCACNTKKMSNACGCGSGFNGNEFSNFNGFGGNREQSLNTTVLQLQHNQTMILAVLGVTALFAYMIYKEKKG